MKKLGQNEKMQKQLKKAGINLKYMASKAKELMECMHPQFKDQPDNTVRHRAWVSTANVLDLFAPTKHQVDSHNRQEITITLDLKNKIEDVTGQRIIDAEAEELPDQG